MTFLKLCLFAAVVLFLLRISGRWSGRVPPLPHWVAELLSPDKSAGQRSLASNSESARAPDSGRGGRGDDPDEDILDDDPDEDESPTDPMVPGVVLVDPGHPRVEVPRGDDPPGLDERRTRLIERMTGQPRQVPQTRPPGPPAPGSRVDRMDALVEHLLRERARPGLTATRIVQSAAGQPHAPWGTVSESTVWRAWRDLPQG